MAANSTPMGQPQRKPAGQKWLAGRSPIYKESQEFTYEFYLKDNEN